ncbi:D-ribose pyranase [Aestuariispira insulae]|uniref:D-ribose pyranase n=1 Tax=Aestuariispira insulae TaxID=1461337 RepID=A0A3D9HHR2_9PROT|nr:D-ribose pyranase [Aestuariispira insulae]RED49049.1 ribose transport protein RbsD [Aestuariispira insulae]
MKRTALLNRDVSALIASLGHLDEIVIADAGLPVPDGVRCIDLAVLAGVPGFFDLLEAVRTELAVEQVVLADEAQGPFRGQLESVLSAWAVEQGKPIAVETQSHESFKQRTGRAKAVIRTGETTPYANVILISGVVF